MLAAREAWAARVHDEQRSAVVFAELLSCLARAGAPFEASAAIARLIGDELRHAELCARMARAFGARDVEASGDALALPPSDEAPLPRALRIAVRELVVGEGESVAVLTAYRDAASDPACRALLSSLLADEARHFAVGRALVPVLRARLEAGERARLDRELTEIALRDVEEIRAVHRAGATGGPGRCFGASIRPDEAP